MMTDEKCAELEKRSMVERYVSGTLGDAETQEFEGHMIGCARCQSAVRLGIAAREQLRTMPGANRAPSRVPHGLIVIGGLAAAAVFTFVLASRSNDHDALVRLGAVGAPPPYQGIEVRSPARADSLFGAAMRLYADGRHADAGPALRGARSAGADTVPTSFFIGVIELLSGRPRAAIDALALVLARGETPYAPEAHFLTAKAWLQLGRVDSASAHLAAASAARTPIAAHARALRDSVAEVRR